MQLPRLQLFEFEDLPRFPPVIRDLATDYLRFIETRFALHRAAVPLLRSALDAAGVTTVVDLCSGGGGPVVALHRTLVGDGVAVHFILTDKYPNLPAFRHLAAQYPGISFVESSVDAAAVPADLPGFRTIFNAFHHFAPFSAGVVLQSAVAARQPIGVFEISERALATILPLLLTPIYVALATPFIRPFRWSRLFWTYLLPLVPLTCWWDGLVSQWRAYTVAELVSLAEGLGDRSYQWDAGRVALPGLPGHLTFLIGLPSRPTPSLPDRFPA